MRQQAHARAVAEAIARQNEPGACARCGIEIAATDAVGKSFQRCTACSGDEATAFLVDWLRAEWRKAKTDKQRLLCTAWAAHLQGDHDKVEAIRPHWEAVS
jgi:hypothetical protein